MSCFLQNSLRKENHEIEKSHTESPDSSQWLRAESPILVRVCLRSGFARSLALTKAETGKTPEKVVQSSSALSLDKALNGGSDSLQAAERAQLGLLKGCKIQTRPPPNSQYGYILYVKIYPTEALVGNIHKVGRQSLKRIWG